MIPGAGGLAGGISGGAGGMPISAGGGAAGDSTATSTSHFGGIKQGAINMGGGGIAAQLPMIAVVGVLLFVMVKK